MLDMREWCGGQDQPPDSNVRRRMMLPIYDPDSYGELWREQSSSEISICNQDCSSEKEEKEVKKPRISVLEIEELEGDIDVGVKTKSLKEVNFVPPVYRIAPKSEAYFKPLKFDEFDADGNQILTLDGFCKMEDISQGDLWTVFHLQGLMLLHEDSSRIANGTKKYIKFSQRFKVAVIDKSRAPYIQLVCNARKAKYLDCWVKEGEVITLFVKNGNTPSSPSPPILSVQPKVEQTYIPMLPQQKLQIITDASQSSLEWRFGNDSALFYTGCEYIPSDRAMRVGTNVLCDFFECARTPDSQELVFIKSKMDKQFKTICVPVLSSGKGQRRYPVIIEPVRTCVVYAHNIDGFILRSYRHIPLRIDKDCPLQAMYTMDGKDYSETKVKITRFQPHFILERVANQWLAKSS